MGTDILYSKCYYDVKQAFSGSGCLSKGTKILKCYQREEQPCQLPIQKHKRSTNATQPRTTFPVVYSKHTKIRKCFPAKNSLPVCLSKGTKDPPVLPSQEQPSRLSLQRRKDPQVLPSQEQPSRLSLQRHKDPQSATQPRTALLCLGKD
ncbi:hypothetical protein GBA52_025276 [Prunus armeniaca]|nr:hypothetical protein GBA52_025276 [Prunus armeniaca]